MQKGHLISSLPVDQYPPTVEEQQLLSMLVKKQITTIEILVSNSKEILTLGGLFALLNLQQTEDVIKKYVSFSNRSPHTMLLVKTLLFVIIGFIIKHFHLVQKK